MPLLKDMFGWKNDEEVDKVVESCSILKGGVLRIKNVSDTVVFLALEDSKFVMGIILRWTVGLVSKLVNDSLKAHLCELCHKGFR